MAGQHEGQGWKRNSSVSGSRTGGGGAAGRLGQQGGTRGAWEAVGREEEERRGGRMGSRAGGGGGGVGLPTGMVCSRGRVSGFRVGGLGKGVWARRAFQAGGLGNRAKGLNMRAGSRNSTADMPWRL